jgi:dimethylglycine dehydrogenase
LSGFAKYDVTGADAEQFLNRICANRMPTRTGGVVLAHILSTRGRIAGEVTITRLADDRFYILSAAGAELRDLDHLQYGRLEEEAVRIENVTDERGVLVLAGPRSRDVLEKLTDAPLGNDSFRWLSGQEITVAGVPVRALRVNYVGELGWELHPLMNDLATLYDATWEAGQAFGIADFGLYAVNSLRIEKAYRGWGAELTNEVTMLDADMERFIKLDKEDFVGREATLKQRDEERDLQLIYFEVAAVDSDVRGGEPIFVGNDCVGVTTSGGFGHFTGKSLGFGYVHPRRP